MSKTDEELHVKNFMNMDVKTVNEETTVLEAAKTLAANDIGAIVVVKNKTQPVGIFTERDLLKKVVAKEMGMMTPVKEVMTSNLVCLQLYDSLEKVPELMLKGNFRHLPVLQDFELMGIMSIKDALKYLMYMKS